MLYDGIIFPLSTSKIAIYWRETHIPSFEEMSIKSIEKLMMITNS